MKRLTKNYTKFLSRFFSKQKYRKQLLLQTSSFSPHFFENFYCTDFVRQSKVHFTFFLFFFSSKSSPLTSSTLLLLLWLSSVLPPRVPTNTTKHQANNNNTTTIFSKPLPHYFNYRRQCVYRKTRFLFYLFIPITFAVYSLFSQFCFTFTFNFTSRPLLISF